MKKPKIKIKNCGDDASIDSFFLDDVLRVVEDRMLYMHNHGDEKKKKKKK